MQAKDLKPGMWVEYQQGVAEVVDVDLEHNTAIIENMSDHRRININCGDLAEQPQLHTGCDSYY
ncbi:hypothetical protein C9I92_22430 [Photobacterium ganghwense]|uniref:Malate dehydrogenase n=1 Tax=Photobacterium ganghwense TaxID=320778 RepID=A0A0J1KA05_9GAMM|nr:hypothetical protein [Photobacterium ganghwense]KLV11172.1 malate dehydrogenase [Photobacterium ganghwense]PSU05202.1 hypothetical protein C9I92_22430 [Photobacterium ganghwense]QSV13825.1 hypothetical protein FH974_14025 [Photobacterium ganghwense]